jgi:hypothetical protein
MAARENLELACLQFEHNSARNPRFFSRGCPNFVSKAANHHLGFRQWDVVLKRVLGRNRFGRPVWDNFIGVTSAGKFIHAYAKAAKLLFER